MKKTAEPAIRPRFFAALDTVDYKSKDACRVAAELQLSLLFGQPAVVSHTQALDGGHFLGFAQGQDAASFLELVRSGHLLISLPQTESSTGPATLCGHLAQNAANLNFKFSAWPEIKVPQPDNLGEIKERKDIAQLLGEAAKDPRAVKLSREMGKEFVERWDALRRVDDALLTARKAGENLIQIKQDIKPLDQRLAEECDAAYFDEDLKGLLRKLVSVGGNFRSNYSIAIESKLELSSKKRKIAHDLVNGAYNRVCAESLGAELNLETGYDVVAKVLNNSAADRESYVRELKPAPITAKSVEGLSWKTLYDILSFLDDETKDDSRKADFLKERAPLAAEEIVDAQGKHRIALRILPVIADIAGSKAAMLVSAQAVNAALWFAHGGFVFLAHAPDVVGMACTASVALITFIGEQLTDKSLSPGKITEKAIKARIKQGKTAEIVDILRYHPRYPTSVPEEG